MKKKHKQIVKESDEYENIGYLLENDEISPEEEGFLRGYKEAQ